MAFYKPGYTGYNTAGTPFVVGMNQFGGVYVELEGDNNKYYLDPQQRWIPHTISNVNHPATIGDLVTLNTWLTNRLRGLTVAHVSGIRTFKNFKRSTGTRQVELWGIPGQWFSVGHFEEYQAPQKPRDICGESTCAYVLSRPWITYKKEIS